MISMINSFGKSVNISINGIYRYIYNIQFYIFKCAITLLKYILEINDVQVINIITYFIECFSLSSTKFKTTNPDIVHSFTFSQKITNLREFIVTNLTQADFIIKEIISYLPLIEKEDKHAFSDLLNIILNAIPSTSNYNIITIAFNETMTIFIPSSTLNFSSISTINKTFFVVLNDVRERAIITLNQELFDHVSYQILNNKGR